MELSKVLLGLMKNAEELWGQSNGTQKKKWVIEQLKHLQWMSEDTLEAVAELIDLIILIDKHKAKIHTSTSQFCFFI